MIMRLHTKESSGITSVSNTFIETYMSHANGDYVKVYLYLLRVMQGGTQELSIAAISDFFDYTEGDVLRALRYWEKEGLLLLQRTQDGSITDLCMVSPATSGSDRPKPAGNDTAMEQTASRASSSVTTQAGTGRPAASNPAETAKPAVSTTPANPTYTHKEYSPTEIARKKQDANYDSMLKILEGYLGHPLSMKEIQTATFIYEELHFSTDLIYHLYEYCVERGKYRSEYIEQVAISWAQSNIHTPDEAANASVAYNADYTAVCKAFGLHRMPGKIEQQFIDRWVKEWGFDRQILVEACNRTLLKIQKPDFKYANSILERWHKEGVHTLSDISRLDEQYKNKKPAQPATAKPNTTNKFNQYPQRQYSQEDYFSLEQRLLERSRNS